MPIENEPPLFFHKRDPVLTQRSNKSDHSSSRKPISREHLQDLIRQQAHIEKQTFQRLNLKRTLLTYLSNQKNFDECLQYNRHEIKYHVPFKLLLVDASFSMKNYTENLMHIIQNEKFNLILYHDLDIFYYNEQEINFPSFSGGTSYSTPLFRISQLETPCIIHHLTDSETSPNDELKTASIVNQLKRHNSYYDRILIK